MAYSSARELEYQTSLAIRLGYLPAGDADTLTGLPAEWFNSGNSEIRNWIVLAGAVAQSGLRMQLVDYVPCYRSEAGTGCAMGFAHWQ